MMSGGSYNYAYSRIFGLVDDIENDFKNIDNLVEDEGFNEKLEHNLDILSDATEKERVHILKEVKNLIKDLKMCALRAKELELYVSGDTGSTTYLQRLKELDIL